MEVMFSQDLTYINNRHFIISTLQKAAERLCKIESPLIGRLWRPYWDFYRHACAEWGLAYTKRKPRTKCARLSC